MSKSDSTPDQKLPKYTPRKLRLLRNWDLGLSQEELAEKMNCDSRTVQRYEKGEYPIPPEFVRKFEELRKEERQRRARELGEEEIDLVSLIIPHLRLIELRPVVRLAGKLLFRMFIAVPNDWIPADEESGQPPPSSAPGPEASPAGRSAGPATRKDLRKFAVGVAAGQAVQVGLCLALLGLGLVIYRALPTSTRPAHSLRVAREAKDERPAVSPAGAHEQKAPDATGQEEPDQFPDETYADGSGGAQPKRSIRMPDKPFSWQKTGPCDKAHGETEKAGGCYWPMDRVDVPPPCPSYAVESENRCYVPVPAKPKKPNTVESKK